MKRLSILLFILYLIGCSSKATQVSTSHPIANNCSIYDSRKWHAQINQYQSENKFLLVVTGEVDLPSPAYKVAWSLGPTDRANPPGQRLFLSAESSTNAASIQVITPTKIEFKRKVPFPVYRYISIVCGGRLLATITDVQLSD